MGSGAKKTYIYVVVCAPNDDSTVRRRETIEIDRADVLGLLIDIQSGEFLIGRVRIFIDQEELPDVLRLLIDIQSGEFLVGRIRIFLDELDQWFNPICDLNGY